MNRFAFAFALSWWAAVGCTSDRSSGPDDDVDAAIGVPSSEQESDRPAPIEDAAPPRRQPREASLPIDARASEPPTSEEADAEAPSEDAASGDAGRSTLDTAQRIAPNESRILVDERSAEQVDYFVFHAEAGRYYEVSTDDARFSPDNALSLYDARGTLIAENDEGSLWPGDKYDTRVVFRAAYSGDYAIKIEDLNTEQDFFSSGFPLLYYYLQVRSIDQTTVGYVENVSGAVVRDYQNDPKLPYRYATVYGQLEGGRATIDIEGAEAHALIARVHPGGVHGNGSTVESGRATVRADDGRKLAEIDRSTGAEHIRPPVSTGSYRVSLETDASAGVNPFFVLDLVLLPDNPSEQNEQANGRARGAEPVTLSRGSFGRGLVLSRLLPGDVDYFRVDVQADSVVFFSCEGESTGSGVRGLLAELRDPADQVVLSASEADDGLTIEALVRNAGPYFLRLSSATSSAEVEPWVRCVVSVD